MTKCRESQWPKKEVCQPQLFHALARQAFRSRRQVPTRTPNRNGCGPPPRGTTPVCWERPPRWAARTGPSSVSLARKKNPGNGSVWSDRGDSHSVFAASHTHVCYFHICQTMHVLHFLVVPVPCQLLEDFCCFSMCEFFCFVEHIFEARENAFGWSSFYDRA